MTKMDLELRHGSEITGDIDSLAATANDAHREVARAMSDVVQHGIRAGEALLAAKAQISRGFFWAWVAENFDASDWTAKLYMRFATYRAELEAESVTNYNEAKALVKHLAAGERITPEEDLARRKEARKLHEEGSNCYQISKKLGVDPKSIKQWVDVTAVAASRRKQRTPKNQDHLDDFIAACEVAKDACQHLEQPTWTRVVDALIERAVRQHRKAHLCACPSPLWDDERLCLRCGKPAA